MKPLRPLVAALVVPVLLAPATLAAQAPAGAPGNPVTQSARGVGTNFGNRLVAAFEAIPADKYGFKPTAPQQSVGYIAQHLEGANYALCQWIGGTTHATTARDSLSDSVKAKWPKDTLVTRLRASLEFCNAAFDRLDDAKMGDPVMAGRPGMPPAPRARAVMLFITDLAEHYAQLASYMRVMGMVPPSAQPRPAR